MIDSLFTTDIWANAPNLIKKANLAGIGEVFLEKSKITSLSYDRNRLANNSVSSNAGFGLRQIINNETSYIHNENLSTSSLGNVISAIEHGNIPRTSSKASPITNLYQKNEPPTLNQRITKIERINEEIKALDPRISNVSISITTSEQEIGIIQFDGSTLSDERPMCRLNISVTVEENGRRETGGAGKGGRYALSSLLEEDIYLAMGKEALRIALVNLIAEPCPAGVETLLLGPGWPGVLFHEAVGHGLEADAIYRKSSAFHNLLGKKVAAKGVNIYDDGTIPSARGSLHFDDEGHPTEKTLLIEDGRLINFMSDEFTAQKLGMTSTGNCRRESYQAPPMPRMTNTFLDNGEDDPKDLLKNMKSGIYAVGFGGGQVDTASGKFVFNCTESYKVENGEILYPLKGATLMGDGPTALKKIIGIGNDCQLDPGIGNCGKQGQWVPVTVGQPSVLIEGITIGGTEL